ncbi:MAG TPA: helix-turn-helix domain-containing protein [Solirubrobacteraceae bacterium]|nr:helix-turn-helix domain-containing protein [Solirubrobacteraceae bacterium]
MPDEDEGDIGGGRRQREPGELPGRRIGGAWRFPRAALLEWLAGRSRPLS